MHLFCKLKAINSVKHIQVVKYKCNIYKIYVMCFDNYFNYKATEEIVICVNDSMRNIISKKC